MPPNSQQPEEEPQEEDESIGAGAMYWIRTTPMRTKMIAVGVCYFSCVLALTLGLGPKTIALHPLDEANITEVLFDGWIDPENIELGDIAKVRLNVSPSFTPMSHSGFCANPITKGYYILGDSKRNPEGKYYLDLPFHSNETGMKNPQTPIIISMRSLMISPDQEAIAKLWRIAVPEDCIEHGVEIEPCIYASRLAFKFTPDTEMAKVVLVYFGRPDYAESIDLEKIRESGVYASASPDSARWLKERGLASLDRLWIWDSEKDSLNYTGQKMFFVYGITPDTGNGGHVIFSDVYIS